MNNDLNYFESHYQKLLKEFSDFLHFRSISADPSCLVNCESCAAFLVDNLKDIFSIELWEKPCHPPIIYATYREAGSTAPTLLLYNHYDVQPADMSDGWLADPFTMRKKGEHLIARGASDNKGQCFYTWKALEHYYQSRKGFPVNITWIIEGEEESDSTALKAFVQEKKEQLQADYFLIVDGGFSSAKAPAVSIGARGLAIMKIALEEGQKDMHSGIFGGIAYNVNRALAEMLASLHHNDNSIAVEGFYDDVSLPKESERGDYPKSNLLKDGEKSLGFRPTLYSPATTVEEALSVYPTLDINGISGGYTGPGFKTVIPYKATAYLSCRLVPKQDPQKTVKQVIQHLEKLVPPTLKFSYEIFEGSPGWRSSPNLPIVLALQEIYSQLYHQPCLRVFMEATIPIASLLGSISKTEPIICGTSYLSDAIHAAEENFSLEQMRNGFLSICLLLDKLAKAQKSTL
ncbi:M20/M25/M40 family metallo-hydrolase [Chlamydia buteonis]|uniref:M20/M25/M40 family metallo-hydrolase n=1 Tax=Chlamydia buteonis TaxID=2494525 RepID=A0ABX8LEZ0_9CHLA|nr:M20/M25/M40 family metallo-hydrolase [Chlamydia buteonis]QXE26863.1 M20 family dipeptidase [Chlamydia buteonis]QXE28190.1 M20/M25/M40 family metallo-hydrolase [Chlamydia buteonis]